MKLFEGACRCEQLQPLGASHVIEPTSRAHKRRKCDRTRQKPPHGASLGLAFNVLQLLFHLLLYHLVSRWFLIDGRCFSLLQRGGNSLQNRRLPPMLRPVVLPRMRFPPLQRKNIQNMLSPIRRRGKAVREWQDDASVETGGERERERGGEGEGVMEGE